MAQAKTRGYVPALDGMRALAVLVVIAYHMKLDWAPGGLLGVTMFFVLSGYLITGLLLKEYKETRSISLSNFWLRRVRRIIPAVVFAVLGTAFLCAIFNHALLTKMRPDVLPTLFFFNNWWQIFHNVSYFEALGAPSPLTHYWSLSIEEQFYLIWPIALLLCMRAGVKRSTMEKGVLVLVVLSALEMAFLFDPHADPSRVYYGTDTRAFSLLIGAFLAFVWPYQKLTERAGERMSFTGRILFNVIGVAAVVGLLLMVVFTNGFEPFIYRGGLVICSLLTAVTIAVLVHPISWISKVFELPPFVWIGKCSYSMYLWHYPIILLLTPANMTGQTPWWLCLIELALIFGISAFSFYFVEDPIRHGAIGNFIADFRAGEFGLAEWVRMHVVPVAAAGVFIVGSLGGLALVPDTSSMDNVNSIKDTAPSLISKGAQQARIKANALLDEKKPSILVIGDSVPEGMYGYGAFGEVFPGGYIDAVVGRQFYSAPEVYAKYRDSHMVGNVVVIALGTNGYATDEDAEALMAEIGDEQRVWFVNTRSPDEYVEATNAAIQRCVDKHANAELIDWYTLSGSHPEYFDGDGTHLTPDAAMVYTRMIYDAVKDYLPKDVDPNKRAASANDEPAEQTAPADNGDAAGDETSEGDEAGEE